MRDKTTATGTDCDEQRLFAPVVRTTSARRADRQIALAYIRALRAELRRCEAHSNIRPRRRRAA